MAARADVDVGGDLRARLAEQRAEVDFGARVAAGQHAGQEGAADVDAGDAGQERERLARPLQGAVAAKGEGAEPVGDQPGERDYERGGVQQRLGDSFGGGGRGG